jgi:ABC-2 type transport system ATP-binding protein
MCSETTESVIEVRGLSRVFRRKIALDGVDLTVAPGGVHGLVGENGAGKTTLIKHLLGLYRAKSGTVRVFGADPVKEPEAVLARVGYLSEDRDLPGWMRIDELLRYTRSFYPNWDPAYAEKLRAQFDLDPKAKVRTLSRGQLAKAGLLTALAHRPDLLLLDEPSSGLDPVVRRNILSAIIRTVADEGRTVLFSSHLLEEVERVADRVTMIHRGRCVLDATLDEIRDSHQRVVVRLSSERTELPTLPGLLASEGQGKERTLICNAPLDAIRAAIADGGAEIVEAAPPSLEEIFVARVGTTPLKEEG